MAKKYTPDDLATFVHGKLKTSKIKDKPSEKVLGELFSTLFYTSLKTEEGQFIKVTATLIDQRLIEKFDDEIDELDKWQFYPFERRLEFNIKNLVKLSKAADPWSSSLAIYHDHDEQLFIYGMIDQAIHYQSFLNYEREDRPKHAGIIQATINGIGILNVMLDYQALATLNQTILIKLYPNVFKAGPIYEFLREKSELSKAQLEKMALQNIDEEEQEAYQEVVYEHYVQALCRILIKIRNYHHGGAILISANTIKGLDPKYSIKYNRIPLAIEHMVTTLSYEEAMELKVESLKKKKMDIPIEDFDMYNENEMDIDDAYNEMNGAVRFAASLSCVDGLVLFSPRLDIFGFGTVITETTPVEHVYVCENSKATIGPETEANNFGTRHRSMFSYCKMQPESVGFVVSQDGDIRAIKSIDGKVFVWENIRVYNFRRSNKLPRTIISHLT
jgi:hypothetical protein